MFILGIETSCDETAVSVLEIEENNNSVRIYPRANAIASQIKVHQPYGGVVPSLASREHLKNIPLVLEKAFQEAFSSFSEGWKRINLIATTTGPGLIPALLIGVNFSRALAWSENKPIIGVNHMEGHLLSFLLPPLNIEKEYSLPLTAFPAITLLVSGGHTQLVFVKKIGDYKIIGKTRDDAAGECFDKGARILGLSYPGGPAIAAEAAKYRKHKVNHLVFPISSNTEYIFHLPRPMINSSNYDFSFSGLKTALLYLTQNLGEKKTKQYRQVLSFELEEAITDVLVEKALKAAEEFRVKSIILGGGVSANQRLREKFRERIENEKREINFFVPSLEYTGDNAIMIALAAFFRYQKNPRKDFWSWKKIKAEANLELE